MARTPAIGHFRFSLPRKDHKRVRLAAHRHGQSMLRYVEKAVYMRLDLDEGGAKPKTGEPKPPKGIAKLPTHDGWDPPVGLGIRARKRARAEKPNAPVVAPTAHAPVVDPLDRFIRYVEAADDADRERRIDEVVKIVKDTSPSDAEAKRTVEELDRRLAREGDELPPDWIANRDAAE